MIMAAAPLLAEARSSGLRLAPFERRFANLVASWVRDARELYLLAPRAMPPLTRDVVIRWRKDGRQPWLLFEDDAIIPAAYGELNVLNSDGDEYWLGHVIVNPQRRGRSLGMRFTRMLLRNAFEKHDARRVSLVVFTGNEAAVRCYKSAGMREDGHESHYFATHRRREKLLRMVAVRGQWE